MPCPGYVEFIISRGATTRDASSSHTPGKIQLVVEVKRQLPDLNGKTAQEMQLCAQLTESYWRNHRQPDSFSNLPAEVKEPEVWGALTDLEHWVFFRAQPLLQDDRQAPRTEVRIQSSRTYIFRTKDQSPDFVVPPERDAELVIGALAAVIFPELQMKTDLSTLLQRGIQHIDARSQQWVQQQQAQQAEAALLRQQLAARDQQLAEQKAEVARLREQLAARGQQQD